jgi:L-serine deaminase
MVKSTVLLPFFSVMVPFWLVWAFAGFQGMSEVWPAVALVYPLGDGGRKLPPQKIRDGMLAAAAVGYLCKHHSTLSAAEGGCQAEIGVASSMAAALVATAHVVESASGRKRRGIGIRASPGHDL